MTQLRQEQKPWSTNSERRASHTNSVSCSQRRMSRSLFSPPTVRRMCLCIYIYRYAHACSTDSSGDAKMNAGASHRLTLHDLPTELLLLIIKPLRMVEVLYSLVGVTHRLDQLLLSPTYTGVLDLTCPPPEDARPTRRYLSNRTMLTRICRNVLQHIHHHVTHLTLEPKAVRHVLCRWPFPQLRSLALKNVDRDLLIDIRPGKSSD